MTPMPPTRDHERQHARHDLDAGRPDAAQDTVKAALRHAPNDTASRLQLADVLLRRGQLRASTGQLLRVAAEPPNDAGLLARTVQALFRQGEIVAARSCLDHFQHVADTPPLLAEQARLRWMLGEIPTARRLMEQAVVAGLATPDAWYLHAMLAQFSGAIMQAGEVLRAALRRWPRFGDAAVALVNLVPQTPLAHDLDLLRKGLSLLTTPVDEPGGALALAGFESAMFKTLDDFGQREEAWAALARSNALMHAHSAYDEVGESAVTDAIIQAAKAIGARGVVAPPLHEGPTPIFVVGLPRSGSTLLERMLTRHSQVASAGELNDFRRQLRWMTDVPPSGVAGMLLAQERSASIDLAQLGARYLQQTQWRAQGKRYYVDKLPINIRMVHLIQRALPHAPILHITRAPMDTCFSNLKAMLGPASAYSYNMHTLAHYHGQYQRLARYWREHLPGAMFDVSYEVLVRDPAGTMRDVLTHCGLSEETACLHPEHNASPVATPSSAQVREPIHTRAVGEWRRYATQLEPLWQALELAPGLRAP